MARQILIYDSTQLSTIFECSQKHDYEYGQSLVQINQQNPELTHRVPDKISAGTLGHKYLEIYYKILGQTKDPVLAARQVLQFDPDKEDTLDPEFPLSAEVRQKVRDRFGDYLIRYAGNYDYEVGMRKRKEIQVVEGWLKDVYVDEPLVEQGFSYELLNTNEYLFVLEGRIDFIGSSAGENLWMDHKWQLSARDLQPKSIQFRNYALVTGFPLGVINYVRLHDKLNPKTTFVRQSVSFNPADSYYWKQELIEMYVNIAKEKARGEFPFRRRSACPGKFGYACPYLPLCDAYTETQRMAIRQMNYTKGREWKPW